MFNENQLHAVEENTPPSTPPPLPKETAEANANNTEIYYMPDNFRKSNPTVRKQTSIPGTWVLGVSILLLILLGGGLLMYWQKPSFLNGILGSKPVVPAEIPQDLLPKVDSENTTPTQDQEVDPVPASSAKQVYIAFRTELASATSADNYLAIYSKYATGTKYETVKNEKEQLELANETSNVLMMLKEKNSPALDGTEDITETSTANTASLIVQRTNKRESGKVEFVLQEGQWKVSEEIWSNVISPEEVSGEFLPGTDDDQDGLTNLEEVALGTNSKIADSDGDSYEDLSEVNNDYNPTGEGKISGDKSLKEYRNSTFNLSILYPGSWDTKIASTDDSVIMTAPDQQFIQLLVQPNTDQEDIISWYKKTFNVENIPISQLITNQELDGVRTPDGLTAYITNKDKSYIFIVTYNLGNNRVLNYKNIFELVLRSLKITT